MAFSSTSCLGPLLQARCTWKLCFRVAGVYIYIYIHIFVYTNTFNTILSVNVHVLLLWAAGRVRRAALHTYIPIYEAMDSSTTYHSWPFQTSGTVPRRCTQRTWVWLPVCYIPTAGFWHLPLQVRYCKRVVRGSSASSWPEYAAKVISSNLMAELGYESSVRCIYIYFLICVYICVYIHIHMHIHIYVYIYIYIYRLCMYTYTNTPQMSFRPIWLPS